MTRSLKDRLFRKQDGRCYYCNVCLDPPEWNEWRPTMPTIDHVIPISKDGRYGPKVLACYECNAAKRNMSVEDFEIFYLKNKRIK